LPCSASLRGADGPADNVPSSVRRVPKPGIAVAPEVRRELETALDDLKRQYDQVPVATPRPFANCCPTSSYCYKAVHDAIVYNEFFDQNELAKARDLIALGKARASALLEKTAEWPRQTGLVVRGYTSKIDGSVQPYGLVVPESYSPASSSGYRLDVWFHGRGETSAS